MKLTKPTKGNYLSYMLFGFSFIVLALAQTGNLTYPFTWLFLIALPGVMLGFVGCITDFKEGKHLEHGVEQ